MSGYEIKVDSVAAWYLGRFRSYRQGRIVRDKDNGIVAQSLVEFIVSLVILLRKAVGPGYGAVITVNVGEIDVSFRIVGR
jgi:hypothetical protein